MRLRFQPRKTKGNKEVSIIRREKKFKNNEGAVEMIKYYTVWQQAIAHFLQACPTVRYYFNTQVPIKIQSCLLRDDDVE